MKTRRTQQGEKRLKRIVNALRLGLPVTALALAGAGCRSTLHPVGIEPHVVGRMPAPRHESQANGDKPQTPAEKPPAQRP